MKDEKTTAAELQESEINPIVGGAYNSFVNIGDIKGESMDEKHKDWIEI
jgi:hypothetical protein